MIIHSSRLIRLFTKCRYSADMCSQMEESLIKLLEDAETPPNVPLVAKYKRSFAFPTMNERAPTIIAKFIGLISTNKMNLIQNYGENAEEEVNEVISELTQLKDHLQTAKRFQEFTSNRSDTKMWNNLIEERKTKGDLLNYYESPWIFAECYLYRKFGDIFFTKKLLSSLDLFKYVKDPVLAQSLHDLGPHLRRLFDEKVFDKDHELSSTDIRRNLSHTIKCSLWANRMDLSLSKGNTNVSVDLIDLVTNWGENILADDTDKVLSLILGRDPLDAVDFVTDNGAMELLSDLILADYLLTRCKVKAVRFRVKPMFWYVSDVTQQDFHATIEQVACQPGEHYKYFGERWRSFVNEGKFQISSEDFWCLGVNYTDMPRYDPVLYNQLKASPLVIFKGDLNYRKLVQDFNWEPTKPFREALGDFASVSVLALRTCKADTIAGLEPGVAQKTSKKSTDWLISGEYGLIQLNSGK